MFQLHDRHICLYWNIRFHLLKILSLNCLKSSLKLNTLAGYEMKEGDISYIKRSDYNYNTQVSYELKNETCNGKEQMQFLLFNLNLHTSDI